MIQLGNCLLEVFRYVKASKKHPTLLVQLWTQHAFYSNRHRPSHRRLCILLPWWTTCKTWANQGIPVKAQQQDPMASLKCYLSTSYCKTLCHRISEWDRAVGQKVFRPLQTRTGWNIFPFKLTIRAFLVHFFDQQPHFFITSLHKPSRSVSAKQRSTLYTRSVLGLEESNAKTTKTQPTDRTTDQPIHQPTKQVTNQPPNC